MSLEISKLQAALNKSWSVTSSTLWSQNNPAKGQCSVTALVVNDILGGEILKTKLDEGWHYYNRINGEIIDFTKSQFTIEIKYNNKISNRKEAFADTNKAQYKYLKDKVNSYL